MRMLLLQRFSVGGNSVTGEDMQNLLIAGLQAGMLGDVEQMIRRTLHIDEFRIYLGRVENGVDFTTNHEKDLTRDEQKQYNWLVSKNLTDRWSFGYTSIHAVRPDRPAHTDRVPGPGFAKALQRAISCRLLSPWKQGKGDGEDARRLLG